MLHKSDIKNYASLIKNADGIGKDTGGSSGGAKPVPKQQPVKSKPDSQSKIAIKQMQTSMIAFRTAFNQLAIGSNEVGRRSTGEKLGNEDKRIEDLKKKIIEAKRDVYIKDHKLIYTKQNGDNPNQIAQATKEYSQAAQNLQNLEKELETAMGSSTQRRDVHGLRPIGQILLNDYIGKDTLQGMTFSDVDMKQPDRMTRSTGTQDNVSFVGVIDSIGRVGTPSNIPSRQRTPQEKALLNQIDSLESSLEKARDGYFQKNPPAKTPEDPFGQESRRAMESKIPDPYSPRIEKLKEQLKKMEAPIDKKYEEDYLKKNPAKGEEAEDGIWDVRTNNSLKNIAAIVQGVLGFSKDMEIDVQGYTQANLEDFKKVVPDDPELLRSKEFKNGYESGIQMLCDWLTNHIKAQSRYVELLRKKLFENPEYQDFMKQEKSLFDFNKTDQDSVNKQHEKDRNNQVSNERNPTSEMDNDTAEYYSNHKSKFDSNYHGAGIQVGINNKQWIVRFQDLDSVTSFENLYKRINGGNEPTKEQMLEFYNQINNSIQQFNQSKDYLAPVDEPLTKSVPYGVKVPSKLPWDRTETRYKTVPKN